MALPIMGYDCAMIGAGRKGGRDVAGQVSIVDETGKCVYNVFVKHKLKIRDYRTATTGITAENIASGVTYKEVRSHVASWIRHRILVGHGLDMLKILGLSHPDWNKRDTSEYWRFRTKKQPPLLNTLAAIHLGVPITNGVQFPYQNARTALALYKKYQTEWNNWIDQQYDDEEMTDEEMTEEEQSEEDITDEEQSDEEESDEEMSDEESEYSSED